MVAKTSVNRAMLALRPPTAAVLVAWVWIALVGGCAGPTRAPHGAVLRIAEIDHLGDARRQASTRLVVEGLDAEIASTPQRALSRYQRAIQIDPGNPFAYLVLARYYAASADSERALEHLDRAQSLLDPDAALYPWAEPHLRGLRGWALEEAGRSVDAGPLLAEARRLAPSVWGDGRLEASELR
ncbi:MAG: tetratricopeptide repeat protein [Myxococcota bacterium]